MSAAMISLLIPTMNRSEFVIRLLKYYANADFKGNILIGDSSNPAQFEKAGEGVRALKGQLKIEHYAYPGMNNYAVTQQLIAKVATPYATFLPDDDFYVPSAIEKCIAFLNAHPDYCCAWGKSILFTLQSSGAFGSFKALSPSNEAMRFSLEEEKGYQRLHSHIKHYTSVFIGVCKTPVLKKALRHAFDLNNSAKTKDVKWWTAEEFGELATSLSMVVQGKIKSIDCLYWIRQGHDQRYLFPDSFDWVTSPNWFDCHQILSRQIIEDVVTQDGIDSKEAEKIWKDLFWGYLCNAFHSGFQASQKKVGAEDKVKVSLQCFPGLYKSLKQMRDRLRKVKSKINNSDDFSLVGLLDPSARYHEDFMPVYRLVTSS